MAKSKTAFVVVQASWFNRAMLSLTGDESHSDDAHLMIGTLDDIADQRGLWLRDVPSRIKKRSGGSFLDMRLMIPWQFILAVGVVDEAIKLPPGFQNVTLLAGEPGPSNRGGAQN